MAMTEEEKVAVLADFAANFMMDPKVREAAGKALDQIYESNQVIFLDESPLGEDEITAGDAEGYDEIDVNAMSYMEWLEVLEDPDEHGFEIDNMPDNVRKFLIEKGHLTE